MPSLRTPLSIKQKLIALYNDPNVYALADHVARDAFGTPHGHRDYRRNVTCFLLDLEARVHTNRQKTARHLADGPDLWNLRRELAARTTGRDLLLAQPPSADDVRKWRNRMVKPESQMTDDTKKADLVKAADTMAGFISEYERLAMARVHQLGQFPTKKHRNLTKLKPANVCSADGTYLRAHSNVEPATDPQTGETIYFGSRSKKKKSADGTIRQNPRVQTYLQRKPKNDRPTMGVNHVAILTRTRYGRVILSVERALGGEVHAALKAMDRVAPLAEGAIWGLTYDKALSGWQIDYLLANHGIVSIAPPIAAKGQAPVHTDATKVADQILAARASAQTAGKVTAALKAAALNRALNSTSEVKGVVADSRAGRALGAGLPLGTSIYLSSGGHPVTVKSHTFDFRTVRHTVGEEECVHELHVDDGALWDTRLERGATVKDQRLRCVHAETKRWARTGWHELHSTYEFVCEYTGEILTTTVHHQPDGSWKKSTQSRPPRDATHAMMTLAPCDPRWGKVYGLRNDCESWFAWLKEQMLDDKRAASLDLNHQLLDVLYAGVITNAITLFNYHREQHL